MEYKEAVIYLKIMETNLIESLETEKNADKIEVLNGNISALHTAVSSLNYAETHKWHDLTANPTDLPKLSEEVLCQNRFGYYLVVEYDRELKQWYDIEGNTQTVFLWRYI